MRTRRHPDTRFLDLSKRRDLDAIFAALAKTNLVVVDCRAAATDLFIDFFNENDLPAMLSAFDAKLTLVKVEVLTAALLASATAVTNFASKAGACPKRHAESAAKIIGHCPAAVLHI